MNADADLTELIRRASNGDQEAADALFSATYQELHKLARARLRRGGRNTLLDTSSLVQESYLRFAQAGRLRIEDRVHFMRWAGRVMRSVIVDFARRRLTERRGGDAAQVTLTERLVAGPRPPEDEILSVHEALDKIGRFDARLVQVVELRYFAGLTDAEAAEALGVTDRTIRRDWEKARLLLRAALS